MSKTLALVTLATVALGISGSFAQAAQVVVQGPTRIGHTVNLACSAGHGDVAQTLYVTNNTNASIAAGTKVSWSINGLKGSFVLQSKLGAGKTVSDLAPAGNGGTCNATIFVA